MFGATFNLVTRAGLPWFLEQWKMIVFQIILKHWFTLYVTETSSKMVSALSQKQTKQNIFCQKAQNFVYFKPYNFVQISAVWGPNTSQIMYGKTLEVQCQCQ